MCAEQLAPDMSLGLQNTTIAQLMLQPWLLGKVKWDDQRSSRAVEQCVVVRLHIR